MAYIEWDDTYSVGISYIDDQHKTLFFIMNEIYEHVRVSQTPNNNVLKKEVARLKEYSYFHFLSEEKQMKQLNFDGFNDHKAEHQIFVNKVQEWQDRLANDKILTYLEITNFLKKWLLNHILVTDKKYSKLFIANGLK